jgi:hypothetical protein
MAIEILRPSGAGSETSIGAQYPNSTSHWDKVDDVTPDDSTTYVETSSATYVRDLYAMQNHSVGEGIIDSVTIYFRIILSDFSPHIVYAKPSQKSGATVTDGTEVSQGNTGITWQTHSQKYTTNPATSAAYTWAEIDSLEVGVSLKTDGAYGLCTQVYIGVAYHVNIVTSAVTRVTSLYHYYKRADSMYRLSIGLGGLSPFMSPWLDSKVPPISPIAPAPVPDQNPNRTPYAPSPWDSDPANPPADQFGNTMPMQPFVGPVPIPTTGAYGLPSGTPYNVPTMPTDYYSSDGGSPIAPFIIDPTITEPKINYVTPTINPINNLPSAPMIESFSFPAPMSPEEQEKAWERELNKDLNK